MRNKIIILLLLLGALRSSAQIDLRQLIPDSQQYMIPITDSLLESEYYQKYHKLANPHLFTKTDSICYVLYEGGDTSCVPKDLMGLDTLFWVNYAGDSLILVRIGDTIHVTYPEPGMGGGGDTTGYWILTTNGGAPDSILTAEVVNLVAGTNMTITQGLTNVTFAATDTETDIDSIKIDGDTLRVYEDDKVRSVGLAGLLDSVGHQSLITVNAVGSDTLFLTYRDGTRKDTVVFYPPDLNDSYIDSTRYEYGDSITIWLLRVDTPGVIDSVPLYITVDSIDTDSQSLAIDTTTALFTLSRDPTATPDLLILPWKDAIRDDYSANYTDSIRHHGYVGINVTPEHPLDVYGSDAFNTIQGRFTNPSSGVASIRLQRGGDGVNFDFMNWGSSFDIRRLDVGGSGNQFLRLDTTTTGRLQHYIWHDEFGSFWTTDYGRGYHVPTDLADSIKYLLSPRADGKYLEVPFSTIVDTLIATGLIDSLVNNGISDSIGDHDWYVWSTTDIPTSISQNIFTNGKAYVGSGTNSSLYQFQVLLDGNNYALRTSTDQTYSEWAHEIKNDTSNDVVWYNALQSNTVRRDYRLTYDGPFGVGVYTAFEEGYNNITKPAFVIKRNGDIGFGQYEESREDTMTSPEITKFYVPKNDTITGTGIVGTMQLISIDTIAKALQPLVADWDFVMLENGDTSYYQSNERDSLLPLYEHTLDSLLWRPGVVRLGDTMFAKRAYDPGGFVEGFLESEQYKPQLQIVDRVNATEAKGFSYLYDWRSITKGDWSFRLHNQDNTTDSIPHYYEIGVSSYHPISETEADTTYRQVLRISSHSNANALVVHQDSIILGDYDPATDIDSTITSTDVTALYVPRPGGVMKMALLDTINAALSIAASTPDITMFERYMSGDSIALNLNGTVDTAFSDLSWLKATISNDTLFQGDDFYVLPQGADSLGINIGNNLLVFGTGTMAPKSYALIGYDTDFSGLKAPVLSLDDGGVGETFLSKDLWWSRYNTADANGFSWLIMHEAGVWSSLYASATDDALSWRYPTTGSFNITRGPSAVMTADNLGQLVLTSYAAGIFDGTSTKYLGLDASNKVVTFDPLDGSETIVTAGTGIGVSGTGTSGTPYVISNTQTEQYIASASFNTGTGVITMPYNTAGSITVDIDGRYDNYDNWTVSANSGTPEVVTTGEDLGIFGIGGDINATISGGNVQLDIPINAIQSDEISNGEVYPVDMAVAAPGAGQDEMALTYENSTGAWEFAAFDPSTSNELQTLSWNAGSSELTISSGNTVTLTGVGGGGGIYGGSGSVGSGTSSVTASVGSTYNFIISHLGENKFIIGTSGTFLRNIASGGIVYVGELNSEMAFSHNGTEGSGSTRMYAQNVGTGSRFEIDDLGTLIITSSSDPVQISGTTASLSTTVGAINVTSASTIDLSANSAIIIDGTSTTIEDDAFIGSSTNDQLEVRSNGSSGWVEIGHEDFVSASSTAKLRFTSPSGNITLNSTVAGSDAVFGAASRTYIGAVGGSGYLLGSSNTLGGTSTPSVECDVFGDIEYTGSLTPVSDRRLKKNIKAIVDPYEKVMSLRPVSFDMKKDDMHKYGYIAQEYQEVFPDQVKVTDELGHLGIMDGAATTYTTAAVQQLIRDNEQQAAQIKVLTEQINKLYDIVNDKK